MTFLDAYALVAFIAGEPAASQVAALLRDGDAAVTVVNLAEVLDVTQRVHRIPAEEMRGLVETLVGDPLTVVAQSATDAWRAADLRARHYDRSRCPLSLADCFLLAAANEGDRIVTADEPVVATARAEGIAVVALPDSTGRRP